MARRFFNRNFRNDSIGNNIADLGSAFLNFRANQGRNRAIEEQVGLQNEGQQLTNVLRGLNIQDAQGLLKDRQTKRDTTKALTDLTQGFLPDLQAAINDPSMIDVPQTDIVAPVPEGLSDVQAILENVPTGTPSRRTLARPDTTRAPIVGGPTAVSPETDLTDVRKILQDFAFQRQGVDPGSAVATGQDIDALLNSVLQFADSEDVQALAPGRRRAAATAKAASATRREEADIKDKLRAAEQIRDFQGREILANQKSQADRIQALQVEKLRQQEPLTLKPKESIEYRGFVNELLEERDIALSERDFDVINGLMEKGMSLQKLTPMGAFNEVMKNDVVIKKGDFWELNDEAILTTRANLESRPDGFIVFDPETGAPFTKRTDAETGESRIFPVTSTERKIDDEPSDTDSRFDTPANKAAVKRQKSKINSFRGNAERLTKRVNQRIERGAENEAELKQEALQKMMKIMRKKKVSFHSPEADILREFFADVPGVEELISERPQVNIDPDSELIKRLTTILDQ